MANKTTNVRADELNYDKYANEIYDDDIRRSIPGHDELHKAIESEVREFSKKHEIKKILGLGHLVENARDDQALEEWAHHHKFLNLLAPIEDQIEWLKRAGFSRLEVKYEYLNTALIIAMK